MKKKAIPTVLSVILVIALMATPVFAKDNQFEGKPFQEIWEAIAELQEWVGNFLETDPVFVASPAAGISSGDISDWDTAYGWGDHSAAGYLTSYTETDPVFVASPAAGISSGDISNWDTAYGWGNHATAGYGDGHSLDAVDGNPANAVYVDYEGDVGIGTTSPGSFQLKIVDSASGGAHTLDVRNSTSSDFYRFVNFERTGTVPPANDLLQIKAPSGSSNTFQFIEAQRGNDVEFKVEGNGNVFADGAFSGGGADFAEMFHVSTGPSSVEPGDVMAIDPSSPGSVVRATQSRSTLVVGIYSTKPGIIGSEREWDETAGDSDEADGIQMSPLEIRAMMYGEIPVAVVGIAPCKVSAENGSISPGDLLVTSSTPGHAMRDDDPKVGTILGKALESLSSGTGVIKVLVTLD